MMAQEFVRVTKTVQDKGQLLSIEDFNNPTKFNTSVDSSSSWYKSLFKYGPDAKEYFDKNDHSIAGFKGQGFGETLVFDLDCKSDPDKARQDAIKLLEKLHSFNVDVYSSVRVFYSGAKGFHLEFVTNKTFNNQQIESYCEKLADGLATFDKVIYNLTRIYRLPNTKHQESGLFKIPLTIDELSDLTIEQIKELAKQPRKLEATIKPHVDLTFLDSIKVEPIKTKQVVVDIGNSSIRGLDGIDFNKCPKTTPRCIYALTHGVMVPGERSRTFFILSRYFRNQGFDKDVCYNTLKGIARKNSELYPESDPIPKDEIWNQHVASAYSATGMEQLHVGTTGTSYDDALLEKYCTCIHHTRPCYLHSKKEEKESLVTTEDIFGRFSHYAENFDKNLVRTGINFLDENLKISTGTVNILAASNGTGKTSMSLTMLKNANKENFRSMMFSMDMGVNLLYLKISQLVTNYDQETILKAFKNKDRKIVSEIRSKINEEFKLTSFDFTSTQSMEDIRNKIFDTEQKSGEKVKFVICDYLSRISGPYSDSHANTTFNSLKSVEVAADTDAAFLYLVQIARNTGNGKTPLRSSRLARDSGTVEDCASSVFSMWRPFLGDLENDHFCKVYLGKNRFGNCLEQVLGWNGQKGLIYDLTPEDMAWYKKELEPREEQDIPRTFGN